MIMSDSNIQIISSSTADYIYRCYTGKDAATPRKQFLACKPRESFNLYRVTGQRRITPDDDIWFSCIRYVIARDEQDALSRCNPNVRWRPSYATVLATGKERRTVLGNAPYYRI